MSEKEGGGGGVGTFLDIFYHWISNEAFTNLLSALPQDNLYLEQYPSHVTPA